MPTGPEIVKVWTLDYQEDAVYRREGKLADIYLLSVPDLTYVPVMAALRKVFSWSLQKTKGVVDQVRAGEPFCLEHDAWLQHWQEEMQVLKDAGAVLEVRAFPVRP